MISLLGRRSLSSVPSSSLALGFAKHGSPNSVLSVQRITLDPPSPSQITIKFLAATINPSDVNQIQGTYPILPAFKKNLLEHNKDEQFAIGGNEGVAEIVHVGKNVNTQNSWAKVGTRVVMRHAGFGTWRQFSHATLEDLIPLPHPSLPTEAAATLMVNPCTAYRMLLDFVPLSPDDVVIQNGANSAVGQAVIQIARTRGIKTVNIIRGTLSDGLPRPGLELLKKKLTDMGADLVVTEEEMRSRDTGAKILELGKGKAPKLGFNCVGGKSGANVARNLENGGVMVTYGGMSKEPVTAPTSLLIFKDLQLKGFWMTRWNESCDTNPEREKERIKMIRELSELVVNKQLLLPEVESVSIKSTDDLEIVKAAFDKAMRGGSSTKQIIQFA
ncbi:hypothetical protein HDU79_006330 [Rhizoclosmatium sp. JEL0117]|nr:hypothetical protein HDU79_006330 [Rhizoclosmatium sp. JEL0117]